MLVRQVGALPDSERAPSSTVAAWGGAECTVSRVGDLFRDQIKESGHHHRPEDFERIARLGLQAVRFPILWERVSPEPDVTDWSWSDQGISILHREGVEVIAGLVHHGSGPRHTSLLDAGFAAGLAEHARRVIARYPWIRDWTPVNEPLTTARFSALYGHWYPHARDERLFWIALLNQIDATRLAMKAIRRVQPGARLVQTEDLGRVYATHPLVRQAAFENTRRWMSWDLLCGKVTPRHPLWNRLCGHGLERRLRAIAEDPCPPDIIGINHYLTSDRFLDHRLELYDPGTHGGNGEQEYADVEAVRVLEPAPDGLRGAIEEAWTRYRRPIALTEVHNGCTREEQVRWLNQAWSVARHAVTRGIDVRAVTAWALFGSHGWDTLLTAPGSYEPGAFDVSSGSPRETALAEAVRAQSKLAVFGAGWWQRPLRLTYPALNRPARRARVQSRADEPVGPLLILGATGTLGRAIARECGQRDIAHLLVGRDRIDLCDPSAARAAIEEIRPWAVINAAGWVRVDDAESDPDGCRAANTAGAVALAQACAEMDIPSLNFSSDLVFAGPGPCDENTEPRPLGAYGASKAEMEREVLALPGRHLIVRTAAFFSPHDRHNFAVACIDTLRRGAPFEAVEDCVVSPTYVPDLCRAALDLLIDGETGIWHLANDGAASWYQFADSLASASGLPRDLVMPIAAASTGWAAPRPSNVALVSSRGRMLPPLHSAIERFAASYRPPLQTSNAQETTAAC